MAGASGNLDDPAHLNAFLSMIGATPLTKPAPTQVINQNKGTENAKKETASHFMVIAADNTAELGEEEHHYDKSGIDTPPVNSRVQSLTSSPAQGTKAPPPTPATHAVVAEMATSLEPIEEDETDILAQLADASNLSLRDSRFAHKKGTLFHGPSYKAATLPRTTYNQPKLPTQTLFGPSTPKTSPNLEKAVVSPERNKEWMDSVLSNFRDAHANDLKKDDKFAERVSEFDKNHSKNADDAQETSPFPAFKDSQHKISSSDTLSERKISQDVTGAQIDSYKGITMDLKNEDSNKAGVYNDEPDLPLPAIIVPTAANVGICAGESQPSETYSPAMKVVKTPIVTMTTSNADEEENRENLTHFKSWGAPLVRNKPASCVRKVILSGLPADTDLTLVQSLISGGAIDNYTLGASGTVAYVTFTSGEACDKFYNKYPNGITFKYRGRCHVVFVEKSKEVDVIGGMLQAYLECGATRCVRAVGADEEWGMKALKSLAEGKGRNIETIIDTYRNKVRTIVFRFTSIAAAVEFKKMLIRNEDWEGCNIQFMDDQCEKATGVHLE